MKWAIAAALLFHSVGIAERVRVQAPKPVALSPDHDERELPRGTAPRAIDTRNLPFGVVGAFTASPDARLRCGNGDSIESVSNDWKVHTYRFATGRVETAGIPTKGLEALLANRDRVTNFVEQSPDGRYVTVVNYASGNSEILQNPPPEDDPNYTIVDTMTGRTVYRGPIGLGPPAYSEDSRSFAAPRQGRQGLEIAARRLPDGAERTVSVPGLEAGIRLSPSGRYASVHVERNAKPVHLIVDLRTGKTVAEMQAYTETVRYNEAESELVAAGESENEMFINTVSLPEGRNTRRGFSLPPSNRPKGGGGYLLSTMEDFLFRRADDGKIEVLDVNTGKPIAVVKGTEAAESFMACNGGRLLVTRFRGGEVRVLDLAKILGSQSPGAVSLPEMWKDLGSPHAARRLQAAWSMVGDPRAGEFLRNALANEIRAMTPSESSVNQHLSQARTNVEKLGDDIYAVRERAMRELGDAVRDGMPYLVVRDHLIPHLEQVIAAGPPLEVKRRLERILVGARTRIAEPPPEINRLRMGQQIRARFFGGG